MPPPSPADQQHDKRQERDEGRCAEVLRNNECDDQARDEADRDETSPEEVHAVGEVVQKGGQKEHHRPFGEFRGLETDRRRAEGDRKPAAGLVLLDAEQEHDHEEDDRKAEQVRRERTRRPAAGEAEASVVDVRDGVEDGDRQWEEEELFQCCKLVEVSDVVAAADVGAGGEDKHCPHGHQ